MQTLTFHLDTDTSDKAIAKALGKPFAPPHTMQAEWSLLDTHDWALWQAGYSLEQALCDRQTRCVLYQRRSGAMQGMVTTTMPRFIWQMPPSPLRDRLAPLWGSRALLPLLHLTRHATCWQRFDDDGKLLVTATCHRFTTSEGEAVGCWLQLQPCRGYHDALAPIQRRLRQQAGWLPSKQGVLAQLLAQFGMAPPVAKPLTFDRTTTAAVALKKAMRHQRAIMEAQQQGIIDAVDTEFLHRYRVALRRMRSLLIIAKPMMPPGIHRQLTNHCKQLAALTTPARDADIYWLNMVTGSGSGEEKLAQLRHFNQWLQQRQQAAYRALCLAFAQPHDAATWKLLKEWKPKKGGGRQPARQMVDRSLHHQFQRLLRDSDAITQSTSDKRLHKLRKQIKHLRYTLECFASLLPAKRRERALHQLKTVQRHLGMLQDICVQQQLLREFSATLDNHDSPESSRHIIQEISHDLKREHQRCKQEIPHQLRLLRDNKALCKLAANGDQQ